MTARQWTLKEPAAIFFIGRSLLNHGHYTHGRNRTLIQTRHLRRCRRRTHRRLASGFVQYRKCAASNLDPDDPTIKVRLGIRFAVPVHPECTNSPVQPGCTNLGLSALLYSRTNANHDGRIPCGQIPAETDYKSSTAGVYSHTDTRRTYGECQALVL